MKEAKEGERERERGERRREKHINDLSVSGMHQASGTFADA